MHRTQHAGTPDRRAAGDGTANRSSAVRAGIATTMPQGAPHSGDPGRARILTVMSQGAPGPPTRGGLPEWPLLAGLPTQEREQVLRAAHRRRYATGEILFHEGDPAEALHLLISGRVAVRVTTPNGDQAVLTVHRPGQAFGELALLGEQRHRSATISALEPSETLALSRAQFDRLRARNPSVDKVLLAALSAQVAQLSTHLLEVLFVPAKARILRQLLSLTEESNDRVVRLTQEDIARMTGTTRSTVNEVLREAERAGAVRIGRKRIEVVDRQYLMHRSR